MKPLSFRYCLRRKAWRAWRGRKPVSVQGLLSFCTMREVQDVLDDIGLQAVARGAGFLAIEKGAT